MLRVDSVSKPGKQKESLRETQEKSSIISGAGAGVMNSETFFSSKLGGKKSEPELIEERVERLGVRVQEVINTFVSYVQEQEQRIEQLIPVKYKKKEYKIAKVDNKK